MFNFWNLKAVELLTSSLRHQRGQRHVDHDSVDFARNWTRPRVALARGDGGESGERRLGPNGHRRLAGDHGRGRQATSRTEARLQRGRRKKEVSRRTGGSPGRPWRRRRPAGRDDGDESMLVAAAGSGRERVGGGDWGPPGTIPSAWRSSTARRSLWWSRPGSGRPTATARCAAAMAASAAVGASSPGSGFRASQHGRLASRGRGRRGGPVGHLRRAQRGVERRRFEGAAADSNLPLGLGFGFWAPRMGSEGGERVRQGTRWSSCPPGSRSSLGRAAWEDRPRYGASEEEEERG